MMLIITNVCLGYIHTNVVLVSYYSTILVLVLVTTSTKIIIVFFRVSIDQYLVLVLYS